MTAIDQKRIARNTLMLYIRMGVIMLIGLLVTRYIIKFLGKDDYGLYGAVGGIVVAFSFLNGVLSSACNRYFSIEIAKNDIPALNRIFCLNVTIFIGIGLIILILAETLGLWYLKCQMNYSPDRAIAVNWVYQFSIFSFMLNMMSTPYQAIIVAHEHMGVFAISSLIEAVFKLIIAFLLSVVNADKLVCYAFLMFCLSLACCLFYCIYSTRRYEECRYSFYWNKEHFKEVMSYTGWNVIGAMAGIGRFQGINTLILNKFFGTSANASWQVGYQNFYINVNNFVLNFTKAFNPQIVKSYAQNEREPMMKLVFQSSKFSYILLFFIILPLFIETPFIIDIWLRNVDIPDNASLFARVLMLVALIDTLSYPFMTAIQATGNIKWYQIIVGGVILMVLPVSYILIKMTDCGPEIVLWVLILISLFSQILRIFFMKWQLGMKLRLYFVQVILPITVVTLLSIAVAATAKYYLGNGTCQSLIEIAICLISTSLSVFLLGMTKSERKYFVETVQNKLFHKTLSSKEW